MKTHRLSSWHEFTEAISDLQAEYAAYTSEDGDQIPVNLLFRGQADAEWKLVTTLERASSSEWSVRSYSELVNEMAPKLAVLTGRQWTPIDIESISERLKNGYANVLPELADASLWAYLRHHSFPSPFLDWSRSPYVAAYFSLFEKTEAEFSSVYMYSGFPKGAKGYVAGQPSMTTVSHELAAHSRHFAQQCQYTVTVVKRGEYMTFESHEEIIKLDREDQDIFVKLEIPRSARLEALKQLSEYNINSYSLMQSEDSLVATEAMRLFEFENL